MNKRTFFLLIIIFFISGIARLYKIDNPVADWHSWRQADTAAVARNFVKDGFDLFHPRFDDLSKIPSGRENPQGYRFVEFPLYNFTQAGLFKLVGTFSLETWGRLVSIFSSLLSMLFVYLLTRKRLGERIALLSAAFLGFTPFNIYYSRTIFPDPSMVMAILGGTYFFDRWIEKSIKYPARGETPASQRGERQRRQVLSIKYWMLFVFATILTAAAFLLKPFALFFTLPIVYLAFEKWRFGFIRKWQLWLFAALTLTPLIAWRVWMQQFPEGIPASDWLFNANNIRFKGAFFYWIFADTIGRLILGYWGIALLVLGLIRKIDKREELFFFSFLVSSLLYLFVIAGGNAQHDYYQILIIPTLAIFLAKGADLLLSFPKEHFSKPKCFLLFAICCVFMFTFGWYNVRDYFNVNNWGIVEAGRRADAILPQDAKVIAPYNGDTAFLYQTNRPGWPLVDAPIEQMIKRGAEYLVIANPTKQDFDGFGRMFKIIASSERYLILDLEKK